MKRKWNKGKMAKRCQHITKEFLEKEYTNSSLTDVQLAEKVGCCPSTIRNKRKLFGISTKNFIKGDNIQNKRFFKILVLNESHRKNKKIYWLCECDCGTKKIISGKDLKSGNTKSCGCIRNKEGNYLWKGYKDLSGKRWYNIKKGSLSRGIPFEITKEFSYEVLEKQDFKCALSGITLFVENNASIDRINSSEGYIPGNIEWVDKDINVMKWDYSKDYFINLCNFINSKCTQDSCMQIYKNRRCNWKGVGNISGDFWFNIKNNAKIRNIPVEVSIEYIWDLFVKQKGKCAISGLPLRFENIREKVITRTASLDRICSSEGYTTKNIWWVHKDINNIKWKLDLDYFMSLCRKISEYQKLKN